ncbi:hypothetical protein ONZ43_g2679 [Nemania bipapillata]|uniref:Uncharacterized protein n=1 Tax=Nemania bipapillata TaxID=110536 RepID=A0ACC2IZN9_9PEZI|nr:hypothetical protein ONZ43_g2679 [Nemania bipapillata]
MDGAAHAVDLEPLRRSRHDECKGRRPRRRGGGVAGRDTTDLALLPAAEAWHGTLIQQLLQFSAAEDVLDVSVESFAALDGGIHSWDEALKVLRALLDRTPALMYCVIDGLNDLEWGGGSGKCRQFLDVLLARQRKPGTVFNILLTTAGQSMVLPLKVALKDRHIATRGAKQVEKFGKRIELQDIEHGSTASR